MRLQLRLLPSSPTISPTNCFVRLHPSTARCLFNEALQIAHDKGISSSSSSSTSRRNEWRITNEEELLFLPLKISFQHDSSTSNENNIQDDDVTTMYVSYNGGSLNQDDMIELSESMIHTKVQKNLPMILDVDVQPLCQVKDADAIYLEPLTTNDWELIEIFAQELEEGLLLSQVSIVYPDQVLPLRVGTDTVYLRVLQQGFSLKNGLLEDECLRLVSESEVVISPKPRNCVDSAGSTTYSLSVPLRVIPTEADFSTDMKRLYDHLNLHSNTSSTMEPCPQLLSICAHPKTLSLQLEGWDEVSEANRSVSHHSLFAFALVKRSQMGKQSFTTAKIVSSETMPPDCIALHPYLRLQLDVVPLTDFLQLQLLTTSQIQEKLDLAKKHTADGSLSVKVNPLTICDRFVQLLNTWRYPEDLTYLPASGYCFTKLKPLSKSGDGLVIDESPMLSNDSIIPLLNDSASISLHKVTLTSEGKHAYGKQEPMLLAQDLPSLDAKLPINSTKENNEIIRMNIPNEYMLNLLPTSHLPVISILDAIENAIAKFFTEIPNKTTVRRNLVITGERGSGKTYLSLMVAAKARLLHGLSTSYIDCRQLQSSLLRMDEILQELTDVFKQAVDSSPSLLILDNLEELIPNTDSNKKDESLKERINPALVNQVKLISDHIQFLVRGTQESFCQNLRPVHILITSQFLRSLHPGVKLLNISEMKTPILSETERISTFVYMLDEQIKMQDNDALEIDQLIKLTESYNPYDLKVTASLVARKQRCNSQRIVGVKNKPLRDHTEEVLSKYVPLSCQSLNMNHSEPGIKWDEIGGLTQAKLSLSDAILQPMRYKLIYQHLPITIPKGILLYGPPGCGKTCIVPALAEECNFNLITCRGPELFDKYIGASEAKVRKLFEKAYAASPSILFLDEFDSLAPIRGSDNTGVTDRVVNQLLTFLDGVEVQSDKDVYIIAATSRPDKIDPALLRPGRLERHIYVGFAEHLKEWCDLLCKIAMKNDVKDDLKESIIDNSFVENLIEKGIPFLGFSAADIKGIFDTASLKAVHEYINATQGTDSEEGEMVEKVLVGTDHLLDSFLSSRPSLPYSDRSLLAKTYVPFIGRDCNDERCRIGLGLSPKECVTSLNDKHTKLKTTLK